MSCWWGSRTRGRSTGSDAGVIGLCSGRCGGSWTMTAWSWRMMWCGNVLRRAWNRHRDVGSRDNGGTGRRRSAGRGEGPRGGLRGGRTGQRSWRWVGTRASRAPPVCCDEGPVGGTLRLLPRTPLPRHGGRHVLFAGRARVVPHALAAQKGVAACVPSQASS
jgi:hypothetical protein